MDLQLLIARDSVLWRVCFYAGMAVVIAAGIMGTSEDIQRDYGIGEVAFHWLQLLAAVLAAVGGKNGMSPMQLKRNGGGV